MPKDGVKSKYTPTATKGTTTYDPDWTRDRASRLNGQLNQQRASKVPSQGPTFQDGPRAKPFLAEDRALKRPSNSRTNHPPADEDRAQKPPPNPLLKYLYDPNPTAINYTTFAGTRAIAEDPSHPYHIRTIRRLEAFDPTKLHWRVQVPTEVSKKSAIRNWAKKRVKRVLARELEKREKEGEGLRGALLVILSKDPKVALTFGEEEAERTVVSILEDVGRKQRLGRRLGPNVLPLRRLREVPEPNAYEPLVEEPWG
ncbi:hypothetical protein PRZ48_002451 [Zasmidium cellare]|uniref:Uncharacterized protein n=1 Tax=Zasmidium cellare TaxID=395010 RepID=A0ABR0F489_ZASCE|nr:hypothetical protein PRZ48_002451 [Zasmidium cellare]